MAKDNVVQEVHQLGKVTYSSEFSHDSLRALIDLFTNNNIEARTSKASGYKDSWEINHNLTEKRSAVIKWFEFSQDDSVLEIGSECGAVTEYLLSITKHVTSYDPSFKNAEVNLVRNKNQSDSFTLYSGDFSKLPDNKYDVIVCTNAHTTAAAIGKKGYQTLLVSLRKKLKMGGTLLFAIENRLGLQYLSGSYEEGSEKMFEGLENYPSNQSRRSFSRTELMNLLDSSGFTSWSFFYPYPNHSQTKLMYSDEYYPGNGAEFPLGLLPHGTHLKQPIHLFSEQAVMPLIEKENLYPSFASSFLVEVKA